MKVAKFGGTSLASAEQIKKVAKIITSDPDRRLIVVSAPGKRFKEDTKVTDLLIKCAEDKLKTGRAEETLQAVIARFQEIAEGLNLSKSIVETIADDLNSRLSIDTSNKERFMDAVKAAGEDNNAKLVASYLQSIGYQAEYVNPRDAGMLVTPTFGNAQLLDKSYELLSRLKEREGILIFPGFFGYSEAGDIVTFSRGGSDVTGSILAAAIQADLYENFTDVDNVYAANPNVIDNPKPIEKITYREMRELSYAGFSVFHEDALIPAFKAKIPVCVKNTNNPEAPGTLIVAERTAITNPVTGIACDVGFCTIYVSKFLMNKEIGFGRRLLQILEDENLSYEHTPSGIDNISVILREKQLTPDKEKRVLERIKQELKVDDVFIERNLALVMIVGEGMRRNIGVADRATRALAKANVNIEMINQGSSEVSMMFGIKDSDAERALKSLYAEFYQNS